MKTIFNWLVLSSADPEKYAATLKGSILFTAATGIAALLHINGFSNVADNGVAFVVETSRALSMGYALYGALRKLTRTVSGTNVVLNQI